MTRHFDLIVFTKKSDPQMIFTEFLSGRSYWLSRTESFKIRGRSPVLGYFQLLIIFISFITFLSVYLKRMVEVLGFGLN